MKKNVLHVILLLSAFNVVFTQHKSAIADPSMSDPLLSDSADFSSTGRNMFFILEPGYQLVLEGGNGKSKERLEINVLHETKKIGSVETRVVEEKESVNGRTVEISKNYFAFNKKNNSIYYFGEQVDIYRKSKVVSHKGSWLAIGKNKPGIIMPGTILPAAKFVEENAPGIAMDKAEIISVSEVVKTHKGYFVNCLKIEETNDLNPKEKEYKYYAEGIGLIKEEEMLLLKYGFPEENKK